MLKNPDYQTIKIVLCQEIDRINKRGGTLQAETTLKSALDKICQNHGGQRKQNEKELKHVWSDLLRNGDIFLGSGISNMSTSFFEVSEKGNETFEYLNRDPGNPQGYLDHLSEKAKIDPITKSYLDEALKTYRADCFKAAAVMLGCASERLILNLNGTIVESIKRKSDEPSKNLKDWKISKIVDGIRHELNQRKKQFGNRLRKRYEGFWSALEYIIRESRNKAGHPADIEQINKSDVHLAFANFAYLVELNKEIEEWILNNW